MSTAASAEAQDALPANDRREPALPFRGDTILGVCEALGQDLGINANWLRVPFAALLLWNAEVVVACYLGLGVVVALSRWLFPVERRGVAASKVPSDQPAAAREPQKVDELAIAA